MKIHNCVCDCAEKKCGCNDSNERWFVPCEDHLDVMRKYSIALSFHERYFNFTPYELLVESFHVFHPDHRDKELVAPLGLDEKCSRKAAHIVAGIYQDIPIGNLSLGTAVCFERTKEGLYTDAQVIKVELSQKYCAKKETKNVEPAESIPAHGSVGDAKSL